jgi:hypothetical protein
MSIENINKREAAVFIAQGTSPAVRITQTGTGDAFVVEDESPEPTPFTISSSGRVGIGTTPDITVGLKLDSTGVKFSDGSIQTTAFSQYEIFEHFLQGNLVMTNLRNLTGNGGSSSSAIASRVYNSTGVVSIVTGTSAAIAHSAIGIDQVNENAIDLANATKNIFSARLAFFTMPNASATGIFYSGFVDNYNANSVNGAYFRITDAGNLFAVCSAGGVETANDLGFRPATGSMNLYEVRSFQNGNAVDFFYNSNLVATITSDIPVGTTQRVNYATGIVRTTTAVTTSLEFDLDLIYVKLGNTGFNLIQ